MDPKMHLKFTPKKLCQKSPKASQNGAKNPQKWCPEAIQEPTLEKFKKKLQKVSKIEPGTLENINFTKVLLCFCDFHVFNNFSENAPKSSPKWTFWHQNTTQKPLRKVPEKITKNTLKKSPFWSPFGSHLGTQNHQNRASGHPGASKILPGEQKAYPQRPMGSKSIEKYRKTAKKHQKTMQNESPDLQDFPPSPSKQVKNY